MDSGRGLACASRELSRLALHYVIPAKAGTQAVPYQNADVTPARELPAGLGTAWVPACAGMTRQGAMRCLSRDTEGVCFFFVGSGTRHVSPHGTDRV